MQELVLQTFHWVHLIIRTRHALKTASCWFYQNTLSGLLLKVWRGRGTWNLGTCINMSVKNNKTNGHLPREFSWILSAVPYNLVECEFCGTLSHVPGGKIRVAVTGCRRFVVRDKRKLMAWKNFSRARFADKH